MRKICKLLSAAGAAVIALAGSTALNADAAKQYYSNGVYRGTKYISYVETDIYWTVDHAIITDSTAYQWTSGILMSADGCDMIADGLAYQDWSCRASITFGIGSKFSYTVPYNDKVEISNLGSMRRIDG